MSEWIKHVKAVAKHTGMSYKEAMSHPDTSRSYHAGVHAHKRGGKEKLIGGNWFTNAWHSIKHAAQSAVRIIPGVSEVEDATGLKPFGYLPG